MINAINIQQQQRFACRIEQAFATAEDEGGATFVSFVIVGYPTKDGWESIFKRTNSRYFIYSRVPAASYQETNTIDMASNFLTHTSIL